jgi:siderophore synthetase component
LKRLNPELFNPVPFNTDITTPDEFEQRICRQLLEALLFEQIISHRFENNTFIFIMNHVEYQARGSITSFGRIRLIADSMYCFLNSQKTQLTLTQLIADLPTHDAMKHKLSHELKQTLQLCQWNQQHLPKYDSRRALSYIELESALIEGHSYHPCFKARTGFSIEDHVLYGPEFGNHFQLHWLAVNKHVLQQSLPKDNRIFWLEELGTATLTELELRLLHNLQPTSQYAAHFNFLPIHPWQWQSIGTSLLGELIQQKTIIHLGAAGDFYQASLSVRTLINVSQPQKANIKLPMNMVNTSSLRTIEPHSVCSAPKISQWLNALISQDAFLQNSSDKNSSVQNKQRFEILEEYAGIVLDEDKAKHGLSDPDWLNKIEGQLSVIFRQSLPTKISAEFTAIPFPIVISREHDRTLFIDPWLEHYGIEAWVNRLIEVVVIPVWHLLVHHGIALEAHAQNTVLLHKDGWPEKVVLRDFHESLEYQKDYLSQPELAPDFARLHPDYCDTSGQPAPDNMYYWMDSVEALRELVVDTLFVFNLTELSYLLSKEYKFSETAFWHIVDSQLKVYAEAGHTDPTRIAAIPLDTTLIQTESLIKKKISDQRAGEYRHTIPNAIHHSL